VWCGDSNIGTFHRLVYCLLEKEFKDGLHALNITAKTPKEIAKAAAQ